MPLRALLLPPSAAHLHASDHLGAILAEHGVRVLTMRGEPIPTLLARVGCPAGDAALLTTTVPGIDAAHRVGLVAIALYRMEKPGPFVEAGARATYRDLPALAADFSAALEACAPHAVSLGEKTLRGWMDLALEEARRGMDDGEVPIGSVLVRGSDGKIVGRGCNRAHARQLGTAHAEMEAFRDAEQRGLRGRRDLILITTMEPCTMCLGAALAARVDTICYALPSPANGGLARLAALPEGATRPRILSGYGAGESRALLADYAEEHADDFVARLLERLA